MSDLQTSLEVVAVIIKPIKCFNRDQMHVAEALLKSERAFVWSLHSLPVCLVSPTSSYRHAFRNRGNGSFKLSLGVTVRLSSYIGPAINWRPITLPLAQLAAGMGSSAPSDPMTVQGNTSSRFDG